VKSNIVYQYFKKESKEGVVFIQFDPIRLQGSRLTVDKAGDKELEDIEFESDLPDQLLADGYQPANALEYHIILKGLA
jgi:hypothetical protein